MGVGSGNTPVLRCVSNLSGGVRTCTIGHEATRVGVAAICVGGQVAGGNAEVVRCPVNTSTAAQGQVVSTRRTGVGEEVIRHSGRVGARPHGQHVVLTDARATNHGEILPEGEAVPHAGDYDSVAGIEAVLLGEKPM